MLSSEQSHRRGGIAQRMILATVAFALVIAGAFVLLLFTIDQTRNAERSTRHSQDVLIAANGLEQLVLDLETGQRGYLLTRQLQFLAPWENARTVIPQREQALLRLVAANRAQAARVRTIAADTRSYVNDYSLPLITAAERGDPSVRTIPPTAEGEARINVIRGEFDQLIAAERRTAAANDRAQTDAARRAYASAIIGIAASIALVAIYAGYLSNAIVLPIRRAAALAGRLAHGDLGARLPETGVGEIGELQQAFNAMGSSLERSRDELRESRARVIATADETRRRFERDLHDGAQQKFVAASLRLRKAQAGVPSELPALAGELEQAADELTAAIDDLRDFAQGIHPAILAQGGLGPALRKLANQSPLTVEVDLHLNGRLPEPVEVAAYYVASEGLTNAAKHGQASSVTIRAEAASDRLRMSIADDGVGGAQLGRGSGLLGLKDRVEALGGDLVVQSEPGAGTSLAVELPLGGVEA